MLVKTIAAYQPDELIHVGDFLDCKAPARWSTGTADEFARTLQVEIDRGHAFLTSVRSVYDGPFHIKSGNHDDRISTYLRTRAPALHSLRALRVPELLGLGGLDITWNPNPFALRGHPGWVCAHGHEGRISQVAGVTALQLARRLGVSVVCGHTHRLGLIHETRAMAPVLWGMEVGHTMDMSKASYLGGGGGNWHQGAGLIETINGRTYPRVLPIVKGQLHV